MNKDIKYLIERHINFDVTDYNDNEEISNAEINNILIRYKPTTKLKLYEIILDKVIECRMKNIDNPNTVYELDLTDIDVSEVTDMACLFADALSGITCPVRIDISNWNTSNVCYMNHMFNQCQSLIDLDLSNFDTGNVKYMDYMFSGCSALKKLDLSNWNTSNVTDMRGMFYNCYNLEKVKLSDFNTQKVTTMASMFKNCWSLKEIDVSNFNTSNVASMDSMFYKCESLTELDLSNFDFSSIMDTSSMFEDCVSLSNLVLPDSPYDFSTFDMFKNCKKLSLEKYRHLWYRI